VLIKPAAAFGEAADDVRLAALDAIQIFAAGLALQVILALRVLTSHPLVVQAESASRRLRLRDAGTDVTSSLPRGVDRIAAHDAISPSGRKMSRFALGTIGSASE
jgi:hypothetical protein